MEYEAVFLDTVIAWMPGVVPHLENWVRSLVSTLTYAECTWRDLSKGWWEDRTHGLGKDVTMRPPPGDEEVSPPILKSEKENKRKRALNSEGKKTQEENNPLDEVKEETSSQVPKLRGTEDLLSRGEETIEEAVDGGAKIGLEAPQDGGGAPKDPLGAIEIGDSPLFPSFSELMIRDSQAVETCHGKGAHGEEDPFCGYFVGVEDVTGLNDLEAPKKSSGEACLSFKLTNQFSASSANPGRKQTIVISILENARVLAAPVGDAIYLRSLVTEENQAQIDEASVLHHEAFFLSRGELSLYEAKNRGLTEERDAFKLLSEQREGEAKGLRAELEASQKEQADLAEQVKRILKVNDTDSGLVANSSVPQVQRKLDVIGKLREEVDTVKAEAEAWKKNMDRLASEKEAARAQLTSAETQLRNLKEKALVQAKKIEEFQSRLGSVTSDRERLATELAAAKSEVKTAKANADEMVAVYRSDIEASQVRAKEVAKATQARANWVAEHAKCQSRRETLEEIHARGFDLTAEIENAKELEVEARVLAFPDDDEFGSMSGSESDEGLKREDATLEEDYFL
ncbi:COP1-interactive protein 1-like [Nicotiana tomentosiformis]|uniref:COP1-interactive protein 1-like n=1 Tax=Nicotiana tomentosiformis TaxID=4098 RepID=UPI00388CC4E8